jgi:hypothetical protein
VCVVHKKFPNRNPGSGRRNSEHPKKDRQAFNEAKNGETGRSGRASRHQHPGWNNSQDLRLYEFPISFRNFAGKFNQAPGERIRQNTFSFSRAEQRFLLHPLINFSTSPPQPHVRKKLEPDIQ